MEDHHYFPSGEPTPNPENHQNVNAHDDIENPISETDGSLLTSQQPQIINPSPLNLLEAQLQNLRIDSTEQGLLHENSTSQQTLAGNSIRMGTSSVRNSGIRPSNVYEGALHGNNIIHQQSLAVGNSRIGPINDYEGALYGNRIVNQQTRAVGNSGIRQSNVYEGSFHGNNIINQRAPAVGNSRIGQSDAYEGALYENNIVNQQIRAFGNSGIRPSSIYEGALHGNHIIYQQNPVVGNSRIRQSDVYEGALYENNIANEQTQAVGNSGIRQSNVYEGSLDGNNIINQQAPAVGNSRIGPINVYEGALCWNNIVNQHTRAVGNSGIGPIDAHEGTLHGNNTTHQNQIWNYSSTQPISHLYDFSHVGNILKRQRYNYITSLEDVRGMVVSMSKEEEGSEFLVRRLDKNNPEDIEFIFSEVVVGDLHDLMIDEFGKRVIKKFFHVLDENHLSILVDLIVKNLRKFRIVCENNIGCKVIQSMMNHLREGQMASFACALKEIAVPLATSQYGSYVLLYFLEFCSYPILLKIVLEKMASGCTYLATNKTGCSVLQKCLSVAELRHSYPLIRAISRHVSLLAPHYYGNYVVQYVIKLPLPGVRHEMVFLLKGRYVELCTNKYASNVVECLLRFSTEGNVRFIVKEIMDSARFLYLLQDVYGNYVAQTALKCSQGPLYDALVSTIKKHKRNLDIDPYGKRVLELIPGEDRQANR